MYTFFWPGTQAEIESVEIKRFSGAGYTASSGSNSVAGGVMDLALYRYRYSVEGESYSSWGTNTQKIVFHGNSVQDKTASYQPIKIYYWPPAPALSVTKRGVPLFLFLGLLSLGLIFWYFGSKYR